MSREVRLLVGIVLMTAIGLVLAVRYTELCELKAVTLNGEKVNGWDRQLGLRRSATILQQPVDSVADALLSQQGIRAVQIDYVLPNTLHIRTNDLTPVCYMLDANVGILYGLDATGRAVPLDKSTAPDWEQPFITGASVVRLFSYSTDGRVAMVIPQLLAIRDRHPQLYHLIEEVDFSRPEYLTVRIAGLPCVLKLHADQFQSRLDEFVNFAERYQADLFTASAFDLRYDDMIVREAMPEGKKKDSTRLPAASTVFAGSVPPPVSAVVTNEVKSAPLPAVSTAKATPTKKPAIKSSTKSAAGKGKSVGKAAASGPKTKAIRKTTTNQKSTPKKPTAKPAAKPSTTKKKPTTATGKPKHNG